MIRGRLIILTVIVAIILIASIVATYTIYFSPGQAREWHLTVYAEGVEESWRALLEEFKKEHPQLKDYTLYVQSAGKISEKFFSEARAGKNIADVIVVSTGTLEKALKEGLLLYYEPPNVKELMKYEIFAKYAKPGYYYPFRALIQGIGINTMYIDPNAIKSYKDLLRPEIAEKFKGRIGMADPRYTVSIELFFFMKEAYGDSFWRDIAKLMPLVWEPKSTVAVEDLASGKIVILIGALGHLFINTSKPIAFIFPEEGVVITPVAAAIPKDAPNPEAAKAFVNWLFTKKATEILVETGGGYPMYPGISIPGLKPLEQIKAVPQNYTKYYSISPEDILNEWRNIFGVK
jgi:iron(III) transport system substrate-binding protein